MNYLLKSSNYDERRKNIQKRVGLVIIVIIILMLILLTNFARQTLYFIAVPIWKLENIFLESNLVEYFKQKQSILNEKTALEQKIFMLGNLSAINNTLQNENAVLKDLLGRKEIKLNTILAAVLVKPPQTPYDILTIDIGEDHQVKVGDKVVALTNIYIGEVSEVNAHLSKVTLYSSPGIKLPVVLGVEAISAEAIGTGGGNFNISLPREVEVKENDVIVIPSIMPNVFGIVEKVDFKDKDSFQTVLFKSPVNISELSWVEVISSI